LLDGDGDGGVGVGGVGVGQPPPQALATAKRSRLRATRRKALDAMATVCETPESALALRARRMLVQLDGNELGRE